MTEQELKNKIMEIIDTSVDLWASKNKRGQIQVYIDKLADALIAAGLKFDTIVSHTATFDLMQQEQINRLERRCAQAEHRAARAERALGNACEDVKGLVSFLIELSERVDGLRVEGYLPEESEPKAYINRAEKELAEERKDD